MNRRCAAARCTAARLLPALAAALLVAAPRQGRRERAAYHLCIDGRQYVAAAGGGNAVFGITQGGELLVFGLP